MKNAIRFVTPDDFDALIATVDARTPRDFPEWFPLVLRTLFATGCRPSELVGTKGRVGREEEEGQGARVSRVKPHHGLRARDVLPNQRIYVEGKHTTPAGRTSRLKPRVVLCADSDLWRRLSGLADVRARAGASESNLFVPESRNGKEALWTLVRKLKPSLPARMADFSPRWLRHSHAIAAIRAGVDLVSVQRQLGHENLATTAIYLRFAGLDEARYIEAFGGRGPALIARSCPSCGFGWREDGKTGALDFDSRLGAAMRRR